MATLLLACACARPERESAQPFHAAVRISPADRDRMLQVCEADPGGEPARHRRLAELFRGVGCSSVDAGRVTGSRFTACTLEGAERARIVVTASLNWPIDGRPAIDDWSAACMLPALYWALRREPRQHSFEFAGFSNPSGLARPLWRPLGTIGGEWQRWRPTPWRRLDRSAVVQLVEFGRGDVTVWADDADPELWLDLASVARALDIPLRGSLPATRLQSDAEGFAMRAGVPVIALQGISAAEDAGAEPPGAAGRFDPDLYYGSYRLIAAYLAYLDRRLSARAEGS